jgi:hypothetical protein
MNRGVPGAVAVTTSQAFSSAQAVSRNSVRFDPHAAAPVQVFAPTTVPTKQAVLGSGRVATARPPAAVQTRAVVARAEPPPPAPTFERRQQAIQQNGGRPLSTTQVREIQTNVPRTVPVRLAPPATLGLVHPAAEPVRAPIASPSVQRPIERAAPVSPEPRSPAIAVHPNEYPTAPKPPSPSIANSALERQHLQEQQRLQAQQEEERARIQQQQELEHQQLARQQADAARQAQLSQQLEQQHEQQTQALLQKHAQEQAQLQQQQQQQRQQQESQTKPPAIHRVDRPPGAEHQ